MPPHPDMTTPALAPEVRERPIIFSAPMVRAILAGRKTQTRRVIRDTVPEAPGMDEVHPKNQIRHAAPYLDAYCGRPKTPANPRGMGDWWCWWTRDDRACPQFKVGYKPGDRLWVREAWTHDAADLDALRSAVEDVYCDLSYGPYYRATEVAPDTMRWRSPIHMPRALSRLTLEVTEVRVERLQDISEADAIAEGVGFWHQSEEVLDNDRMSNRWCRRSVQVALRRGEPRPTAATNVGAYALLWERIHGKDAWDANPWVAVLSFRRFDTPPADTGEAGR